MTIQVIYGSPLTGKQDHKGRQADHIKNDVS